MVQLHDFYRYGSGGTRFFGFEVVNESIEMDEDDG